MNRPFSAKTFGWGGSFFTSVRINNNTKVYYLASHESLLIQKGGNICTSILNCNAIFSRIRRFLVHWQNIHLSILK